MKMSKNDRQEAIIRLIRETDISTQDELVSALIDKGLSITQVTISRDIKELGLVKVFSPTGGSRYTVLENSENVAPVRLLNVFSQSLVSCNQAGNMIVIKTLPGMAQGAAAALDAVRLEGIVGTIAGDDTIFAATADVETAAMLTEIVANLKKHLG